MNDTLRNSAQRVQNILKKFNISAQVIEFNQTTRTAQEAAQTIGCEVAQIAKTLIFKGKNSGKAICVIASGINRIDEKKVAQLIGEPIEKPDAEFVLKYTTFAIGGVPPIGYDLEIKPLIDQDLMQYKEIWAAAGTPFAVFNISPQELVKITQGNVVDIKKI